MDTTFKTIKRNLSLFRRHSEKYVVAEDGCWNWTGSTTRGYGTISCDGASRLAHRVSWVLFRGPIPDGKLVLHKCNNRRCVNPEHLYIGTYKNNARDRVADAFTTAFTNALKKRCVVMKRVLRAIDDTDGDAFESLGYSPRVTLSDKLTKELGDKELCDKVLRAKKKFIERCIASRADRANTAIVMDTKSTCILCALDDTLGDLPSAKMSDVVGYSGVMQELNPRHYKILQLVRSGHNEEQIAEHLNISIHVVSLIINSPSFKHELSLEVESGP